MKLARYLWLILALMSLPALAQTVCCTQTIAHGTATMGTTAISSGACSSTVTVSAPGVVATDTIYIGNNSNPTGVTGYAPGGGLAIRAWPTSGNVNFCVSNEIGTSVTPGALTINWSVTR